MRRNDPRVNDKHMQSTTLVAGSQFVRQVPPGSSLWAILAAMRFTFAMWVVFAHTYNFGAVGYAMPVPSKNALVAVYCFLAISGFSIHHSIAAQRAGFWMRRFWRIAPTHLVSLVLAILVYLVCGKFIKDGYGNAVPYPSIERWIGCALLLQAILPVYIDVLFPAWSLSIEIIYYMAAPLLQGRRVTMSVILLLASAAVCLWRPALSDQYIGIDSYGLSIDALFWAWISGWLAYQCPKNWVLLGLSAAIGFTCIAVDPLLSGWFNYTAWAAVLAVQFLGDEIRLGGFVDRIAQYLGELSYPAYLLHYPLFFLLLNFVFPRYWNHNTGLTQVVIVLLVTALVYHFVDAPLRRRSHNRKHRENHAVASA